MAALGHCRWAWPSSPSFPLVGGPVILAFSNPPLHSVDVVIATSSNLVIVAAHYLLRPDIVEDVTIMSGLAVPYNMPVQVGAGWPRRSTLRLCWQTSSSSSAAPRPGSTCWAMHLARRSRRWCRAACLGSAAHTLMPRRPQGRAVRRCSAKSLCEQLRECHQSTALIGGVSVGLVHAAVYPPSFQLHHAASSFEGIHFVSNVLVRGRL